MSSRPQVRVPFPELTDLQLSSYDETLPVVPDSFLGGSAPSLEHVSLSGIPFPGLPKVLLSAAHLVDLRHFNIPHSGYISPEAMVALLSALSSLEVLFLKFESPQSRPDWESRSLRPPNALSSLLSSISFQRRYRISRGTRYPYRHASTQLHEYNFLQSNQF